MHKTNYLNGNGQQAQNGHTKSSVDQIEQEIQRKAEQAKQQKQAAKVICTETASSWMEVASSEPDPLQLFGPLLHEGELTIFFASSNTGKSALAVQLGDAISRGASVFPELPNQKADPVPVQYIDFELSKKQFEARYKDHDTGQHKAFSSFFYRAEINRDALADKPDFTNAILDEIEEQARDFGLIIIDNLTTLLTEQEKSSNSGHLMARLNQVKKQTGCSILLIAHTPKRNHSEPLTMNDLAGSANLSNLADSVFALGQNNQSKETKYLKQINTRSAAEMLSADSVATVQIEKAGPDLRFEFIQFQQERDHLKDQDEAQAEQLKADAQQLYDEGYSYKAIGDKLGIGKSKVYRIIKKG